MSDPNANPTDAYPPAQYPPAQYSPAQYPPAQYASPAQYAPNPYPAAAATNVFAIVALVLAFVVPIGAIVVGHIALSQIKRTGEQGRGIALAGTIIGYAFTILAILAVLAYVVFIFFIIGVSASSARYDT
ncbi:DUF4190 domain-containing protein [Subtercola lobariae]|uniref:DUF4190 domain-containing protein n=1 Tax=Subtercola lobariae TaxID=1588641 RepID=A0A917BFR4_9MICO|nr:DUF4190 domain-containing protein [Subtercola lobariae]GGF40137.1 hypothetical protein GCM10011399_36230 [Subtercola lobariae]